jgi:hypothetical protein
VGHEGKKERTIGENLRDLALRLEYDEFRTEAMKVIPDYLKTSFGAHLMDFWVDVRAGDI